MMQNKLIITGASGHIGYALCLHALKLNKNVLLLLRSVNQDILDLNVEVAVGDIFNRNFLESHIKKGDVVIHCAAFIDLYNKERLKSFRVNYLGTRKIADVCLKKQARLMYMSSVDIIKRENNIPICVTEDVVFRDLKKNYQTSKALATAYVLNLIKHKQLNATIIYPTAVIGIPDQKPSHIGKEILKVLNQKILWAIQGGYNFIDVNDLSQMTCDLIIREDIKQIILSGQGITIKNFYQLIINKDQKKTIITLPKWLVYIGVKCLKDYSTIMLDAVYDGYDFDSTLMNETLNYTLKPLEETINEIIHALKKQQG